jgi:hypothetical protein
MIDIESYFISLKASWVSRLADSKFSNWKLIPLKYLNVFGFPFHINLKHLLSISFLYFSGITHELTIKVKIGIIKALMISTFPNIERFRF